MTKSLQLVVKLYVAIKTSQWDKANELVDSLKVVLETYKRSC